MLVETFGESLLEQRWEGPKGRVLKGPPGWRSIQAAIDVTRSEAIDLVAWLKEAKGFSPKAPAKPSVVFQEQQTGPSVSWEEEEDHLRINARGQGLVLNVEDYIREARVDTDVWQVEEAKGNTWTTAMKQRQQDGTEKPVIVRNWSVKVNLRRRLEAQALEAVRVGQAYPRSTKPAGEQGVTLVIPDSQHGYRWVGDGRRRLEALHDEAACDLAVQVAQELQPERIILLGDMADFAELSTKFPREPALWDTTQATLQALHDWLARLRAACPAAKMVYLEGNHEARVRTMLITKAAEVSALRAVGEGQPALSLPRLLALDALDVEYVGPYGQDYWINPRFRANHGLKVRNKGGATAQAVLAETSYTTAFGHVHRREMASKTVHGPGGRYEVVAFTPGCLCRVDGAVPGAPGRPDWQQGLAVVTSTGSCDYVEIVPIAQGTAMFRGKLLYGVDTGPLPG